MSGASIPVHVLTGFLGSGKTTLLRHLLAEPALADTAVVINEFGEVGLDHLLVRELAEDVVLLSSGCVCCALKDDLNATLMDLLRAARVAEIPYFSRVVLETTGLADPLPIVRLLRVDARLTRSFRLGNVITSVDAVNGLHTIEQYAEAVQQIAAADRLVVTKTDLATLRDVERLNARVLEINPTTTRLTSTRDHPLTSEDLFGTVSAQRDWAALDALSSDRHLATSATGISAFTITLDAHVDFDDFIDWLDLLLARRGNSILRVKGYLAAIGYDRPYAIQGVQQVLDRPEPMRDWPSAAHRTQLVFIAKHVTRRAIENALSLIAHSRG